MKDVTINDRLHNAISTFLYNNKAKIEKVLQQRIKTGDDIQGFLDSFSENSKWDMKNKCHTQKPSKCSFI